MIEDWLSLVLRQGMLYSMPVLLSLSVVVQVEALRAREASPFARLLDARTWLPLLTAILLHRGIIVAFTRPARPGMDLALLRFGLHALLCLIGFLLFAWSQHHPPAYGLPPMHYWWSKVLMFFNLCMCAMHLLPLPGMLIGEWICHRWLRLPASGYAKSRGWSLGLAALAGTPLLDMLAGSLLIFPVYEWMATVAARL